MPPSQALKILLLGPKHAGKSCMANFLASLTDITGKQYIPTKALRICEFERKVNYRGKVSNSDTVQIELWDCSGDQTYASCWPSIIEHADGILFMYNPAEQQESDLQYWYETFAVPLKLKESSCLIFAHYKSLSERRSSETLTGALSRIAREDTCLDTPNEKYRQAFDSLIVNILVTKQEKDEEAVLNQ